MKGEFDVFKKRKEPQPKLRLFFRIILMSEAVVVAVAH